MDEVLNLMANGAKNRSVGATNQNEHSSRYERIINNTNTTSLFITYFTSFISFVTCFFLVYLFDLLFVMS